MNMKKFLLLVVLTLLLTGCGADNTIKIGTIKYLNVNEDALIKSYAPTKDANQYEPIFFDNISGAVAALQAGQIDELSTYECVGNYLVYQNQNLVSTTNNPVLVDMFCCAMREEDTALKAEFDAAINEMNVDGTLTRLIKTYIHDANHGDNLTAIEMPAFYDDSMIKIGVTGDLPIFDYIRADNTPAGFNTAVLAEISKRIGKNFMLVQVDSGARAVALQSGEIDVIFWVVTPKEDRNLPKDFDKPEGVILTVPYFSDEIVHVKLTK